MKKMMGVKYLLIQVLVLGFLGACSGSDTPPEDQIEAVVSDALTKQTKGIFSLDDFEVKAQENIGSETDPVIKSRIAAKARLNMDLYELKGTIPLFELQGRSSHFIVKSYSVLQKAVEEADDFLISGFTESSLEHEKWRTRIRYGDIDMSLLREPLQAKPFKAFDNPVLEGSDEYEDALAEADVKAKKMRQDEEKAMKEWEKKEEKIKQEQEKKDEQRLKGVKSIMKSLQGTWKGTDTNTNTNTSVEVVVSSNGISIEYIGICKKGTLSNPLAGGKDITSSNLLVFEEVSSPCVNSTDKIVPVDESHFRLEYISPIARPIDLYRQ